MSFPRSRLTAVLGTAVAVGGVTAGIALGQSGGTAPITSSPTTAQSGIEKPDANEKTGPETGREDGEQGGLAPGASSVQAPNTPDSEKSGEGSEAAEDAAEKAEAAELAALATVDQGAAEKAALAKVPGTVGHSELGNENGNVVWQVEVIATGGGEHEVTIDAGNGALLLSQEDGED